MHILYLHQYFCPPGGAGNNRSYEFARTWVEAGHEVTLVCSTAYFPVDHPACGVHRWCGDVEGIRVIAYNVAYRQEMSSFERIKAFLKFFRYLLQEGFRGTKPDLVYASSTPLTVGEAGRIVSKWRGIPLVFETVDVWPDVAFGMGYLRNRVLRGLLNGLTNRIYRRAKLVVCLSPGMRRQVLQHTAVPGKVRVSLNGTNVSLFRPMREKRSEASGKVELIYAGAVGTANGVNQLIGAVKLLTAQPELPPFRLTVIGWGNQLAAVQAMVQQKALQEVVQFLPPLPKDQLAKFLPAFDIGVATFAPYPVLEANSANKFYDYCAAGLPVVLNYEGWQARHLRRYYAGLSAPQGDLLAFVRALRTLILDAEGRRQMGRNARLLAEAHYHRPALASSLLEEMSWEIGAGVNEEQAADNE